MFRSLTLCRQILYQYIYIFVYVRNGSKFMFQTIVLNGLQCCMYYFQTKCVYIYIYKYTIIYRHICMYISTYFISTSLTSVSVAPTEFKKKSTRLEVRVVSPTCCSCAEPRSDRLMANFSGDKCTYSNTMRDWCAASCWVTTSFNLAWMLFKSLCSCSVC